MAKPSLLDILFSKDEIGIGLDSDEGFYAKEFSVAITKNMKRILTRGFFKFAKNMSYFLAHVSAKSYGLALQAIYGLPCAAYGCAISNGHLAQGAKKAAQLGDLALWSR